MNEEFISQIVAESMTKMVTGCLRVPKITIFVVWN